VVPVVIAPVDTATTVPILDETPAISTPITQTSNTAISDLVAASVST